MDMTNSESPFKSQDSFGAKPFELNPTKFKTKENRQEKTVATFKNVARKMVLNSDTKLAPVNHPDESENHEVSHP